MLLSTAFADMETRLAEEQLGWTKAVGACEASLMLQLGIQLARRTRRTVFVLYVNLKTFFPAVHRGNATVAELLIGLPEEFTDTVGALFGELTGEYEAAHGLRAPFRIYMGVLMGDVLSPDRAKILLNAVTLAIRATAKGMSLQRVKGGGRQLLQILYADDWAGLFDSLDQLLIAWAISNAFCVTSGCELGISKLSKTVVAGVQYDKQGKPSDAFIPD